MPADPCMPLGKKQITGRQRDGEFSLDLIFFEFFIILVDIYLRKEFPIFLMKKILICFFLAMLSLYADLEDHFKKFEHGPPSEQEHLHNIDFIYMINLDQRPEKWHKSLEQ